MLLSSHFVGLHFCHYTGSFQSGQAFESPDFLLITYFEVEVHATVQYNKKEGLQSIEVIVSKTNCSVCG